MTQEELTLNVQKALEEIRPFLNSDGGDITMTLGLSGYNEDIRSE